MPIEHDFLELSYEKIGFLVNRDQFFSSIYLEENTEFTEYNGEKLFTFNMDECLNEQFSFESTDDLRLALICDITVYTKMNKKRFEVILDDFPEDSDVSAKYLSLKIGSQAEINSIPLSEIKMLPGAMQEFQLRRGILGMRFKENGYPQFLIDIEQFMFNSLFKDRIIE
ncbi:MAG: hypothetical protein JEZ04_16775 [Spirochaetales bacterium]|nr:hypothetical protein [Spirochaetales bacterium]